MSRVFVVDAQHRPLDPCRQARARVLLTQGKAAVWRYAPFTIILTEAKPAIQVTPLRVKIDPGAITTGLAMLNDTSGEVVWAADLIHRGPQIKKALAQRRAVRRSRRYRHTRYRSARFANRRRPTGWLPPSLLSRIQNCVTWVQRFGRYAPIGAISQERVKFDLRALEDPDVTGIAYQYGTLYGYEIRTYLLEKWHRRCAYCRKAATRFEIDHVVPRSRGGSDRVGNLVLSCAECNRKKGTQTADAFGFPEIATHAKMPLRDAAAVNSTRWALYDRLKVLGLPVETGTEGRTAWNRATRGLPKAHWVDASCVGASTPEALKMAQVVPWCITATGRQCRQMCRVDKRGFVRTKAKTRSRVKGFATGDLVKAIVPGGKKQGTYRGRVAIRATGSFNITTGQGIVQGIPSHVCTLLQCGDGYQYAARKRKEAAFPPAP
ncbi:MAG: RNA-guided endonuclease IscB [Chloroflexota bacterium]|nr:RNA-guided endonuclease IscB [Chloroflexota bacterium]